MTLSNPVSPSEPPSESSSESPTTGAVPGWPRRPGGIAYGGDYNPEQWPEQVWREDVELMGQAGVNLVSVGIFSWALLEPAEGQYDFDWLDRVLELLHQGGVAVDLATPTAAPPAWLVRRYPEVRPQTREGVVLGPGARNGFCPSSPAYAEAATRITEQLAKRYAGHPAVVMWHVHNEYGGHVPACYCERSAAAFRRWLADRYGDLAGLNRAWGTAFWGQRYGEWEEIEPPRAAPTTVNPAQQLDFLRFSNDAYLACFIRERDLLRGHAPGIPITTNFMATACKNIDYWRWAAEVDVVANDHYLQAEQPENHIELSMTADLTRSLAGGRPWMLMEHSTSAVNWQPRNIAKRPGELRRNSLAHFGRGADSVMFFQWRAGASGAEKFHSAMVPHGGTDTRIWREVVELGADLRALAEVRGSEVAAQAAVLWDWQSWWALELEGRPSVDVGFRQLMLDWYEQLWRAGLTVDFAPPDSPRLDDYPLVVVPNLYLLTEPAAANLARYVERGGTLVVSFFSGIVDADERIHLGGYPGALRELLGVWVPEFRPLRAGETVRLRAADGPPGAPLTGDVWAEEVQLHGAEAIWSYEDGPAAGAPAVTRHPVGDGAAWYVSTRLRGPELATVLARAYADAGVPVSPPPAGVELVRRVGEQDSYLVAINHSDRDATVAGQGHELLTGADCAGQLFLPAGQVRVVREAAEPRRS
ncbi:beta-galactosidase [Natronosporangium hydrolyticum]|uniref:beta-galactosidase n=1 Tax=Natronosporangium hydrolyticum TaxID=2811111 RepID=UPI001EFA28E3|nr:beta-galactosidase [Natronosporangium hydrolyticum]